jgi:hypothetical protein
MVKMLFINSGFLMTIYHIFKKITKNFSIIFLSHYFSPPFSSLILNLSNTSFKESKPNIEMKATTKPPRMPRMIL